MKRRSLFTFLAVLCAITAWTGLVLQQYILIDNTPENGMTPLQAVGRFLIFFTILSNGLVAICFTWILISPGSRAGQFTSQPSTLTAIAVYIFMVGLVYNLLLRSLWHPVGRQQVADELLHVVVPVLVVIYWFVFVPKGSLAWKNAFPWLIFPAAYIVYVMVRGSAEKFYPYPFIDVGNLGFGRVLLNSGGLFLAFLLISWLFIAINKWKS